MGVAGHPSELGRHKSTLDLSHTCLLLSWEPRQQVKDAGHPIPNRDTRLPGCQTTQPPPIKDRHPPPPPPKHLTNQTTPTITATTPAPPTLLTLPLELRLQIYTHLLALHPLPTSPLPADYPSPSSRSYFLAPIIHLPLLSPGTTTTTCPLCHLPTALLLTSRQLYLESRLLPFQTNEFSFVTWFSSGLSAARAVLAGWVAW